MKERYRLFLRRKSVYYAFDNTTKKFQSLETKDKAEAAGCGSVRKSEYAKNDTFSSSVRNLMTLNSFEISYRISNHLRSESNGSPNPTSSSRKT
jgi:hypothetical protein